MALIKLESTQSTNEYVKLNRDQLQNFDVVYTFHQTHGKGRKQNLWYSSKDSLTFSICIKTTLTHQILSTIPFFTGYILHQALIPFSNHLWIKWPNDILLEHKKVAGILTESIIQHNHVTLIVGIGINVNQTTFPDDLTDKAISLRQVTSKTIPLEELLNQITHQFISQFNDYIKHPQDVINYCQHHLAYKGQTITFQHQNKEMIGQLKGINSKGHLIVQIGNQQVTYLSGEIKQIHKTS